MTVFIASLFLPYTIDFKTTGARGGRRRSSLSHGAVDGSNSGPIVGRLPRLRSGSIALTPGATTEDEKIFKAYASHFADEVSIADDPKGPGPSEPRAVPWGRSNRFNQPRSTATTHPEPSILNRPPSRPDWRESSLDGAPGRLTTDQTESPRALLSAVDWAVKAAEQGHGGLQNAVHAAEEAGVLQSKMWVGTLGMPTDSLPDLIRNVINETLLEDYDSLTVFVGDGEFEGHYAHFCRAVLWPALHYQMQESPRHTDYDDYSWKQYLKVNEAFADAIASRWKPGDRIWVHDYHLLSLPALLRARLPHAEIGFFLHTPFPSSEIFRCLNPREALLDGLLGADLIGFQTEEYCYHFLHSCSRIRKLEGPGDGVQVGDRFVRVKKCPLGIDYKSLNLLRQSVEVKEWINSIINRYRGKHLIVARDRLDAPGGIKQKLLAYELFLKTYPNWRENVVLVQVASSASEIPELEAQVSKIAMRINSVYSTLTHQPLVLLQQDISYSQFLALLSVADIFMATNLREGLNLTSHDFIHCQDGELASQQHGSLILSEFTGSASIFQGHELLVNPWDYKRCADAINKALEMSPEQKKRNWQYLLDRKSPYTALAWFSNLQFALTDSRGLQQPHRTHTVSPLRLDAVLTSYNAAESRLLFLEYDAIFPSNTDSYSSEPFRLLQRLALDSKNVIYLTSNRSPGQLDLTFRSLPAQVGLIAENGCFAKFANTAEWKVLFDVNQTRAWRADIRKVFECFHERTEGSVIEERRCSLNFNYEKATDQAVAARQASALADQINRAHSSEDIRVVRDSGFVSVVPLDAHKAVAASMFLDQKSCERFPDFIFVAGGDGDDDALFRWANRLTLSSSSSSVPINIAVTTLSTGTRTTEANCTLPAGWSLPDVLLSLLLPDQKADGEDEGIHVKIDD
ncbi:hypothetical protein PMG11_02023 [Penicillium brasilianum]|uniref:Uncharacterized protein n=1 Tax=Penicillium brasilianum TaxID=104259 RepID=A0A0F7TL94_PENBI|nr:hypothetical protein PMG11_02023 [Penicillium brasilianum]